MKGAEGLECSYVLRRYINDAAGLEGGAAADDCNEPQKKNIIFRRVRTNIYQYVEKDVR